MFLVGLDGRGGVVGNVGDFPLVGVFCVDTAYRLGGRATDGLNILGRGAGGSVAALAALNFTLRGWEPKLTTFGQPKFGDADFMKFFDEVSTFVSLPPCCQRVIKRVERFLN